MSDPIHHTFVQRPYPGALTHAGHPSPVPHPLHLSDAEAADGLAILDEVLSIADG